MSKFFEVLQLAHIQDTSHLGQPARSSVTVEPSIPNSQESLSNRASAKHTTGPAKQEKNVRVCSVPSMLLTADQNTEAAEEYRIIITKIVQHATACSLILVTSACAGDGKSVTALNLAFTMAMRRNTPVLLLSEAYQCVLKELGLHASRDLADVLGKHCSIEEALIVAREAPNLHLLPIGTARRDVPAWLDSSECQMYIPTLRERFKYIIIDAPPVGAVSDYYHLEALSEGLVFVVRPEHTGRAAFCAAMKSIQRQKLLGVVVNDTRHWLFQHQKKSYVASAPPKGAAVRERRAGMESNGSKYAL